MLNHIQVAIDIAKSHGNTAIANHLQAASAQRSICQVGVNNVLHALLACTDDDMLTYTLKCALKVEEIHLEHPDPSAIKPHHEWLMSIHPIQRELRDLFARYVEIKNFQFEKGNFEAGSHELGLVIKAIHAYPAVQTREFDFVLKCDEVAFANL